MRVVWSLVVSAMAACGAGLPPAGTILEHYVTAIGGTAAHQRIRTIHSEVKIEFLGTGRTAARSSWRAAPNKSYSVTEIPGIGRMEEGTDGNITWSISPQRGPLIKSGEERELALRAAAWNGEIRLRELYPAITVTGIEQVDGRPCYKLLLTPPAGASLTRYFDQQSGLLVRNVMQVATPAGEVNVETNVSDYRDVDGVRTPFHITQKGAGPVMVFTIERLEYNIPVPDSRFALPSMIRQLMK